MPEKFVFEMSSLPGTANRYELGKAGEVRQGFAIDSTDPLACTPTAQEWKEFGESLRRIGAQEWKSRYVDSNVLDGCSWELIYKDNQIRVKASGLNDYPESFDDLETAVSTLLGIDRNDL